MSPRVELNVLPMKFELPVVGKSGVVAMSKFSTNLGLILKPFLFQLFRASGLATHTLAHTRSTSTTSTATQRVNFCAVLGEVLHWTCNV